VNNHFQHRLSGRRPQMQQQNNAPCNDGDDDGVSRSRSNNPVVVLDEALREEVEGPLWDKHVQTGYGS